MSKLTKITLLVLLIGLILIVWGSLTDTQQRQNSEWGTLPTLSLIGTIVLTIGIVLLAVGLTKRAKRRANKK